MTSRPDFRDYTSKEEMQRVFNKIMRRAWWWRLFHPFYLRRYKRASRRYWRWIEAARTTRHPATLRERKVRPDFPIPEDEV
jgi:hypothetical protein